MVFQFYSTQSGKLMVMLSFPDCVEVSVPEGRTRWWYFNFSDKQFPDHFNEVPYELPV